MSKSMPTLGDFRKTVPKGGLLNKSLRNGVSFGGTSKKVLSAKPKGGNFKNVGIK